MSEPTVGSVLVGRYRLVAPIGGGAMGTVWRAARVDGGDEVAIKLLSSELRGQRELVERFEREATLVRGIDHPAVCPVFDHGTYDDGTPFLAMELIRGESLAERLERSDPMKADAFLATIIAALDGLEAVHRAGIVHRDLKPENIFLTADGAPKLIDFGVSKGGDAQKLTATGDVLGTPIFMAPEQADNAKAATPAADVYGVGAILYDGLAGQAPFDAPSLGQLLMLIAFEDPPPLAEVRPGVPEELARLVHTTMAKSPAERPASAAALSASLAAILARHRTALAGLSLTRTASVPTTASAPSGERRAERASPRSVDLSAGDSYQVRSDSSQLVLVLVLALALAIVVGLFVAL